MKNTVVTFQEAKNKGEKLSMLTMTTLLPNSLMRQVSMRFS